MKLKDLNENLIGKKVKGVFLATPVTGTIVGLVEDRSFMTDEVCGRGVKIALDKPIFDGTGAYTGYESTARIPDEFGNLKYTELI